jgi:hypothetical protein
VTPSLDSINHLAISTNFKSMYYKYILDHIVLDCNVHGPARSRGP